MLIIICESGEGSNLTLIHPLECVPASPYGFSSKYAVNALIAACECKDTTEFMILYWDRVSALPSSYHVVSPTEGFKVNNMTCIVPIKKEGGLYRFLGGYSPGSSLEPSLGFAGGLGFTVC